MDTIDNFGGIYTILTPRCGYNGGATLWLGKWKLIMPPFLAPRCGYHGGATPWLGENTGLSGMPILF